MNSGVAIDDGLQRLGEPVDGGALQARGDRLDGNMLAVDQEAGAQNADACSAVARVGRPLTETVVASTHASLPVRQGQVLGQVVVREGSRVVGRRDLVASRTINKPGAVGRLRWYAGRTLHHLTHLF